MSKNIQNRFLVIFILGLLSAIGPFSIDMYLPGFQAIANDLNTSIDRVQLSLTSFFIGIALGQIIYGPLLDRFGRKPPLLIGLAIYVLASMACGIAKTADQLILFRFLQALGSCAGMVAARAMVRDFFPPDETAKIFSLLMLVIGISPIIAPTIGSYFVQKWDWHYIFFSLAFLVLILLSAVAFLLKGTAQANKNMSLKPKIIIKNYLQVISFRQFIVFALIGAFASSGMYAYLSGSPFVMMEHFGLSEKQYGWAFAFLACGLIIASQLNTVLLKKYKSEVIAKYAAMFQAIVGLSLFFLSITNQLTITGLIALIFLYLSCQGFIFPNTSALALNPFKVMAGSASALLGCIQLSIGALSSSLVSIFHNYTSIPMTSIMAITSFCGLLMFVTFKPGTIQSEVM